jgi:hypothetical protein
LEKVLQSQYRVQQWLSEFNSRYGHDFSLDNGLFGFNDKGGIEYTVEVFESSNELYFHAALQIIPQEDGEKLKLFEKLLQNNLFGEKINDGRYAVDSKDNMVIFWFRYNMDELGFDKFEEALSVLVNAGASFDELISIEARADGGCEVSFDMLQNFV